MSIENLALVSGGTTSTTGGTAIPLGSAGGTQDRHQLIATDDSLMSQRTMDFSVKRPVPKDDAPNGYTQSRREVYFKFPMVLTNGVTTVNTARITISADIEADSTEITIIRDALVQALNSADLAQFFELLVVA